MIHFQIIISANGTVYAEVIVKGTGKDPEYLLDKNYILGEKYKVTILAGNGKISVTYGKDGKTGKVSQIKESVSCGKNRCYFKAGNYLQVRVFTEGIPVGFRIGSNLLLVDLGLTVLTLLIPTCDPRSPRTRDLANLWCTCIRLVQAIPSNGCLVG